MSTQGNEAVVRRFAEEAMTQGNMESAAMFVWEDVVEQVPLPGQGPGLGGLKDILRAMRAAFPDLNFAITEQIAQGDKVASRFEWTGTHQSEFFGVPVTGRQVRVWGIVIDRLEKGRIKDTRIVMDSLVRVDDAVGRVPLAASIVAANLPEYKRLQEGRS